jgi:spermidine/putrescine transport system ATP-binding protein
MTMSDRIAVMNRGRYEQLGDPESLYERPQTRFVAGFLGVSNLFPGTVQGRDGEYATIALRDGSPVRAQAALVNGASAVDIGVRPEKIRLHAGDGQPPAAYNRLAGVVRDASYLGVSTSYIVETPDGTRLTVYEQNTERTSHGSLNRPGDAVTVSWSPDHSFVIAAGHGVDDKVPASPG